MADLKGQVKLLEEKTTTYMQQNLDLEEVFIITQYVETQ